MSGHTAEEEWMRLDEMYHVQDGDMLGN